MSGIVAGVPKEVASRRHGGRRLMKRDGTAPAERRAYSIKWEREDWLAIRKEAEKIRPRRQELR